MHNTAGFFWVLYVSPVLILHLVHFLTLQISRKDDTIQSLESEVQDAKEKQQNAIEEVCGWNELPRSVEI